MSREKAVQITYLLLRIVAGWMFFQAGAAKILNWFGGMPPGQTITLMSQVGIGGLMELIGGILIMLGLFTRPTAFLLSGEMAVAYWQFHAPNGTWPLQNGGVPAALYCFVFLYMAAQGGGIWSLDEKLRRARIGVAP
jgi:putative oxidoreductase